MVSTVINDRISTSFIERLVISVKVSFSPRAWTFSSILSNTTTPSYSE